MQYNGGHTSEDTSSVQYNGGQYQVAGSAQVGGAGLVEADHRSRHSSAGSDTGQHCHARYNFISLSKFSFFLFITIMNPQVRHLDMNSSRLLG